MTTQTPGASAPITTRTSFTRINAAGDLLFEVRPGVPAVDALEMASCYMASARDMASDCAQAYSGDQPDHFWAAFYLIEMAKAVLDASIKTLIQEINHA